METIRPARSFPACSESLRSRSGQGNDVCVAPQQHVRQLLAGVPVRIVAAGHDTSVKMIERTYSAHITDHTDALVRGAMLDLAPVE